MAGKSNTDQRKRFINAAREVEADEDPEAFKDRLKKLLQAPTNTAKKSQKRRTKK